VGKQLLSWVIAEETCCHLALHNPLMNADCFGWLILQWAEVLKGETAKLALGYYVVRNPSYVSSLPQIHARARLGHAACPAHARCGEMCSC